MAANLINIESDNSLSFGDYSLNEKSKAEDFPYEGNLMKVKTFKEITKLEKNGMFVYESVPGTSVYNFTENADGVAFFVEGNADDDAQSRPERRKKESSYKEIRINRCPSVKADGYC